jgi:predicted RNA-binding Zn-ribbon protein involved in translation (DUF1610 family)
MKIHSCDMLVSFYRDKRIPIERTDTQEYLIRINQKMVVLVDYCPWCGQSIVGNKNNRMSAGVCEHIKEFIAAPDSSIIFLPDEKEYSLCGRDSLIVNLFYCPSCGRKLPSSSAKRCVRSVSEVKRLTMLFADVKSINEVIQKFGSPDFERPPMSDYFHWKGKRVNVGFGRSLFYERLSKTIDIIVIQKHQGLNVKLLAKKTKSEK